MLFAPHASACQRQKMLDKSPSLSMFLRGVPLRRGAMPLVVPGLVPE